ncbi:hypothetical protein EON79_13235 [bacterium]|nr:MAG: hypothetical protein EON79_13235 [bacterium]
MLKRHGHSSLRTNLRWSAIAVAATAATFASAQNLYFRELPDYDQKRNALPSNGGMYCVPTSYVDMFRYMAAQGFSNLDKGFNGSYSSITSFISLMGIKMDTDAGSGTNVSDAFDVAVDWTENHSNQGFMHVSYSPSSDWGTGTIKNWMQIGAMVRLGYGRYHKVGNEYKRDGGHSVASGGYYNTSLAKYFFITDPATHDGNIDAQGAFTSEMTRTENVRIHTEDYGYVTHARLGSWSGSDGKWMAFIDNIHIILPMWGGWVNSDKTTVSNENLWASISGAELIEAAEPTTFHAVFPNVMDDGKTEMVRELDVELPGKVKDWCFDPSDVAIYVLGEDDVVSRVHLLTKETTKIAALRGARKLAVAGRKCELFVLMTASANDLVLKIDTVTGKRTTLKVAKGIDDIKPDPATLGIAGLHTGQKKLFRMNPDLTSVRPQTVDLPDGTGPVFVGLSMKGDAILARNSSKSIVRTPSDGTPTRNSMTRAPKINSFQPYGTNRYIIQEGEALITYDEIGRKVGGAFDAVKATGLFQVAPSWKAFNASEVGSAKWRNVEAEVLEPK